MKTRKAHVAEKGGRGIDTLSTKKNENGQLQSPVKRKTAKGEKKYRQAKVKKSQPNGKTAVKLDQR